MSDAKTHPATDPAANANAEKRAALFWVGLVVAILGVSFITAAVMFYVASSDPSFGVETDYYQKALHWDDFARQRQINERLGWTIALGVADDPANPGARTVRVRLTDGAGEPILGARVEVEAFHSARSANRLAFTLESESGSVGEGAYATSQRLDKPGLWVFRFTVNTTDATFTDEQELMLGPPNRGRVTP